MRSKQFFEAIKLDLKSGYDEAEIRKIFKSEYLNYLKIHCDENKDSYLLEERNIIDGFQDRLLNSWKEPIDALEIIRFISADLVREISDVLRNKEVSVKDDTRLRLHGRVLQIASEIIHLIKGGFAEGAMARWRSLHETTVILVVLSKSDEQTSIMFRDHYYVTTKKTADDYNKYYDKMGAESLTDEEFSEICENHQKVLEKHGDKFNSPNSWASIAIGKGRVSKIDFKDIEEASGLQYLRPAYNLANQYIHSGADSIGFKLGLCFTDEDLLLIGPSNGGLSSPIQFTALSLCQANSAMVFDRDNDDWQMFNELTFLIFDFLKTVSDKAHDDLEEKHETLFNS